METSSSARYRCQLCGRTLPYGQVMRADLLRPMLIEQGRKSHPDWSPQGYVCLDDLDALRIGYVRDTLETGRKELSAVDEEVLGSLGGADTMTRNINEEIEDRLTLGQQIADRVASFGGSWRFIILFGLIILVWITLNGLQLLGGAFDPFPFILLNLVLSCLAALQAPVIMMSQNRQEARDRLRAEHDYMVNLKAELEIRMLTLKLDGLLHHQWQRLMEIQEVQTELLEEMRRNGPAGPERPAAGLLP